MYQLTIRTKDHPSQVLIGESYLNLPHYLPKDKRVIVVTDDNILQHYGDFIRQYPTIVIGKGEKHKNMVTLEHIYHLLLHHHADRDSFVVAIGGGIVCDVTGFAASTYMRGLPFGFVSTTLLSQVDASVGGKNGVNFGGYKNMVGTFNQPQFVLCDTEMTKTLPHKEFVSGFAEIVKAAAICDTALFSYLEQHADEAIAGESEVVRHLVIESVKIKAQVVERDEQERGERRILNFGHTFGHAIELQTGIAHGEAVSIGMMIAARWSMDECGLLQNQADRIKQLLMRLELPVTTQVKAEDILHGLEKDKKRQNDTIHFVLLNDIGKTEVRQIPIAEIEEKLPHYLE